MFPTAEIRLVRATNIDPTVTILAKFEKYLIEFAEKKYL